MKPLIFATAIWMLVGQFTTLQAGVPQAGVSAAQHPFLEWGGEYPRWSGLTPQQAVADIRQAIELAKKRMEANVNFDLLMELLLLEIQENG